MATVGLQDMTPIALRRNAARFSKSSMPFSPKPPAKSFSQARENTLGGHDRGSGMSIDLSHGRRWGYCLWRGAGDQRGHRRRSGAPSNVVRAHYSPFHPMRMMGVFETCEGLQGDGGAVAEGEGEHCSKVL